MVTLADIAADTWDDVVAPGYDLVFLMGVWERSPFGREIARADAALRREYDLALPDWTPDDVVGSPYCIRNYVPDARVGGWDGLIAAREALHGRGVRLVVDFVPNHTAFDHPWVSAFPDRYVRGSRDDAHARPGEFRLVDTREGPSFIACGRDPYFPPWRDVAQLDYFNAETRAAVIDVLRQLAGHCDGVRCDMAMLVVNDVFARTWPRPGVTAPAGEFWPEAIAAVPGLTWVAEVYWDLEWTLQQQGFHYTYDKRLLDRLRAALVWQSGSVQAVRDHLGADAGFSARLVRFLENHDEERSASTFGDRLPAAAAGTMALPGLRFMFDGQREGRRVRAPVQLARWLDEPPNEGVRELYERLMAAVNEPIFHGGDWALLDVGPAGDATSDELVCWRWRCGDDLSVVAVNLGSGPAQGNVRIAGHLPAGAAFDFVDVLSGNTYRWQRAALDATGLYVRLNRGRAHLFQVTAV